MKPFILIPIAAAVLFGLLSLPSPARAIENQNEQIERARNPDRAAAARLIEAGRYGKALPLLRKAAANDPGNADIENSLGFAYRKLKQYDAAMRHYKAALKATPLHRGANEYLGELYLELGRLEEAEERLKVLDAACKFRCEEYEELERAIAEFKSRSGRKK